MNKTDLFGRGCRAVLCVNDQPLISLLKVGGLLADLKRFFVVAVVVLHGIAFTVDVYAETKTSITDVGATASIESVRSSQTQGESRSDSSWDRYRADRKSLLDKSDSSALLEQGRCTADDCQRGWSLSGSSTAPSLAVINPTVTFRATHAGANTLAMSVRWRAPAPEAGLTAHDVSYYEVLLDFGDHFQIYQVNELAEAPDVAGGERVRQWLHLENIGSRRPEVRVRPIYIGQGSGRQQHTGTAMLASGSDYSLNGFGSEVTLRVGDIDFADSNLKTCVEESGHSGPYTPVQDLTAIHCPGAGIWNVKGIEELTALRVVYLADNPLVSIDAMSRLIELESLNIDHTDVVDFSVISPENFPWMRMMSAQNTGLSDLSNIARLVRLKSLQIADTAVQVIPDLSTMSLEHIDISNSPVTDLSGLSGATSLRTLEFRKQPPPFVGEPPDDPSLPIMGSSGDLVPLITLAQNPANQLATLDLDGQLEFSCGQLHVLADALGDLGMGSGTGVILISPASCVDLPVISPPVTSLTPSINNNYVISWESVGNNSTPLYQVQQIFELDGAIETIDTYDESVDFELLGDRLPGRYHYRVRACTGSEIPIYCTSWSQSVEQVVLGSTGLPGEQVIAQIPDPGLRSCVYDRLVWLDDDGVLVYRNSGELTSLSCQFQQVAGLDGIDLFPNLTSVNFYDNLIDDLSPMGSLLGMLSAAGQSLGAATLSHNQIQGDQLQVLVQHETSYVNLYLNDNPLGHVNHLSDLKPVFGLGLERTQINSLAPLSAVSIGSLRASGNMIAAIPPLNVRYQLRLGNNALSNISGLNSLGADFMSLDLSANPLGAISAYPGILATLDNLSDLTLQDSGITTLDFVSDMPVLTTLDVSSNPLTDFSPLAAHPSLRTLKASHTLLADLDFTGSMPDLGRLELIATQVSSLSPLASVASLSSLLLSGGNLAHETALAPLSSLYNLRDLVLYDTGIVDVAAIIALLDDPDNNFGSTNLSRIDILREPGPTCRQVHRIWQEGLLFSLEESVQTGICTPDLLDITVVSDSSGQAYNVSWQPSFPPLNYTGTSYYEVAYTVTGTSDGQVIVNEAASGEVTISVPQPHQTISFRARACRDDGVCSAWSDQREPLYPPQQPFNLAFDADLNTLSWDYQSLNPPGQAVYFEIAPLFPVFEPIRIEANDSGPWHYNITNPTEWPGLIARVRACYGESNDMTCGTRIEVRMGDITTDPSLSPPENVFLDILDAANGLYQLSWDPVVDERLTHYRVRESVPGGNGPNVTTIKEFAIEADQLTIRRYAAHASATYEVSACQRNREQGDVCSTFASTAGQPAVTPPGAGDISLGRVGDLCWDHVDGEQQPDERHSGHFYSKVSLRWRYNTDVLPRQFNGQAVADNVVFSADDNLDASLKFSDMTLAHGGEYFWEVKNHLEDSGTVVGPAQSGPVTVGVNASGHTTYEIRAAIPEADTGQWLEGPVQSVTPLLWQDGEPVWNRAQQCSGEQWPQEITPADRGEGGPGALTPGHWTTSRPDGPAPGMGTGWRFYWTSAIEYDPAVGTFGLSYDLLAVWYTYQLLDGVWSPVWLYSRMQTTTLDDKGFVEGALMYPVLGGSDEMAGTIRIYFEPPEDNPSFPQSSRRHAWLDLSVDLNGLSGSYEIPIRDFLLDEDVFDDNSFGHPTPSSHFRGIWLEGDHALFDHQGDILHNSDFMMSEWADSSMTSMAINFFDDNGRPIWFIHFECDQAGQYMPCSADTRPDIGAAVRVYSLYTYYPSIDPFYIANDIDHTTAIGQSLSVAYTSGSGIARKLRDAPFTPGEVDYDPAQDLKTGLLCVDLRGALGNRQYSLQTSGVCRTGTIQSTGVTIFKIANFHDIDYMLPGTDNPENAASCDLEGSEGLGTAPCELLLTWFTDDYFPDIQPMYSTATDGTYRHINELCVENTGYDFDFAVVQKQCTINDSNVSDSETLRFHLINNLGSNGEFEPGKSDVIATSRTLTVTGGTRVDVEEPLPPVVAPPPPPSSDPGFVENSSKTGATRGAFDVSPSGTAEYMIPIMVTAGSGGVAPELSLGYNSMLGVGPVGAGWQINGASAITRCGQTFEQDDVTTGVTLTDIDRFCLDGQRLILVDGQAYGAANSEYRLEIDSLVRIVAKGQTGGEFPAPTHFIVQSMDGASRIFGAADASDSAAVLIPDDEHDARYAWPLAKFEDSAGNYILYHYKQPGQTASIPWIEWVLDTVAYTGNSNNNQQPYATVSFDYQTLNGQEITAGYVVGARLNHTQRLKLIESKVGSELLRKYHLDYIAGSDGTALLSKLQECWRAEAGEGWVDGCYEPLTMDWHTGSQQITEAKAVGVSSFNDFSGAVSGDLSGSGRQKIVTLVSQGSSNRAGFRVFGNADDNELNLQEVGTVRSTGCAGLSVENLHSPLIADLDGDGLGGVLYAASECGEPNVGEEGIYYHPVEDDTGKLAVSAQRIADLPSVNQFSNIENNFQLSLFDLEGDGVMEVLLTTPGDSSIWVYPNHSVEGDAELGDKSEVHLQYDSDAGLPPRPVPGAGLGYCPVELPAAEFEDTVRLLKTPPVAVDQSGRTAFMARVTRTARCQNEHNSEPGGPEPANSYQPIVIEVFSNVYVFQIIDDGENLVAKVWDKVTNISDKYTHATDLNNDGYTDFLTLMDHGSDEMEIHLYRNDGIGLEYQSTNIKLDKSLAPFVQVLDITGDGLPDILVPSAPDSHNATWDAHKGYRSSTGDIQFRPYRTSTNLKTGHVNHGSQTLFIDLWGNGLTAMVGVFRQGGGISCAGSNDYCLYAGEAGDPDNRFLPRNKVHRFTDGFGTWTEIEYGALTQSHVHHKDGGGSYGFGRGAVVYDINMPFYVVSSATSMSPHHRLTSSFHDSHFDPNGTARIDYFYTGAKIQAGGRGFLGFRQVATLDGTSGVLTVTDFEQAFPLVGRPLQTSTIHLSSGIAPWRVPGEIFSGQFEVGVDICEVTTVGQQTGFEMGRAINTWALLDDTHSGLCQSGSGSSPPRYCQPYLAESVEYSCAALHDGPVLTESVLTHAVITETTLTGYGEVSEVVVTTEDWTSGLPVEAAKQSTRNFYAHNDVSRWHLGRLSCAEVTSEQPGSPSITRRSAFAYDGNSGILTTEYLQPDHCQNPASARLTTHYTLDGFGNRVETEVMADDVAGSRRTRKSLDVRGRYVDAQAVHVDGSFQTVERVESRDHYGNPTEICSGQGRCEYAAYDYGGRPYLSWSEDGSWQRVVYRHSTPQCPLATRLVEIQTAAGGAETQLCKDAMGREIRKLERGFNGQWISTDIRYDIVSRPLQVSEPYVDAGLADNTDYCTNSNDVTCLDTPYWTSQLYDPLGRQIELRQPNYAVQKTEYIGLSTRQIDPMGHAQITHSNVLGQVIQKTHESDGATTGFGYDALGQLLWTDGPLPGTQDRITIDYNDLGHKTRLDDPDMGTWHYRHNAFGELVCQMDANGNGIYSEYDELGRLVIREDRSNLNNLEHCAGTAISISEWIHGNVAGHASFGQVIVDEIEVTGNDGSAASTVTRTFQYDSLGRLETAETVIDEGSGHLTQVYEERTTYDQYGRIFQEFDASGDQYGTRLLYGEYGHLQAIREARDGAPKPGWSPRVYWQVDALDARGHVIEAQMGNGMQVYASHDPATGELVHRSEGHFNGRIGQLMEYEWDQIGQLVRRTNLTLSLDYEHFEYDTRNRLTHAWRSSTGLSTPGSSPGEWQKTQQLRYDISGNILCKSDVSPGIDCNTGTNYFYEGSGHAGPHAVTRVNTQAGNRSFQYDANGNVIQELSHGTEQRRMSYNPANLVRRVTTGNEWSEFHYGLDRQRSIRRDGSGTGSIDRRTHYIGNVEILRDGQGNLIEKRRYIAGVALMVIHAHGSTDTRYQHRDHLGSIIALSNEFGEIVARMGFDAWGQRRDPHWNEPPWVQWTQAGPPSWAVAMLGHTSRGYTGHTHLDDHGIIHMNGRIYDPHLARFLQADPFVEDTATLNRYSYVHNNPLLYTDPSGYLSFKDIIKIVVVAVITVYTGGLISGAWGFAAGTGLSGGAALAAAGMGGALSGYVMTGSLEGALWGAFSAMTFYQIGQTMGGSLAAKEGIAGSTYSASDLARASVAHGIAGGTISKLQGGRFGHGALSAGINKLASPAIQNMGGSSYYQGAVSAIVGGSVSSISGGKFANGAVTAAMSYAFGSLAQREQDQGRPLTENEIAEAKEAFGDLITDYDSVRVFDRKWMPFQGKYVAMAPDGNIYWPAAGHCQDLTQCTITYPGGYEVPTLSTFIHEMGHVMQHQQGINVVMRALPHQVWSGLTFGRYNPYMSRDQFYRTPSPSGLNVEAQADWYRHSYCTRTGKC